MRWPTTYWKLNRTVFSAVFLLGELPYQDWRAKFSFIFYSVLIRVMWIQPPSEFGDDNDWCFILTACQLVLGLFYLGCVHCTFIFTLFVLLFLKISLQIICKQVYLISWWYSNRSIWSIDDTLKGTTTLVLREAQYNDNEEVLHTPWVTKLENYHQMLFNFIHRTPPFWGSLIVQHRNQTVYSKPRRRISLHVNDL